MYLKTGFTLETGWGKGLGYFKVFISSGAVSFYFILAGNYYQNRNKSTLFKERFCSLYPTKWKFIGDV